MSAPAAAASPAKTLRRLYLTLFLRGRSSRGLHQGAGQKSIGARLAWTLFFYALFGLVALGFFRQSLFALSLYLHASTLMFLGMFLASAAGEALFNAEESEILLHRPVDIRTLLWAKVNVLVQISLWLAGAFNVVGFCVGAIMPQGNSIFLLAHAFSLMTEALFCTGLVVVSYQLCLRWFGRERLDGMITTVQTLMSIVIVLGSQLAPRWLMSPGNNFNVVIDSWWVLALPPAWFAGIDDALAGSGARASWALAGLAVATTAGLLWLGFGTLARNYASGLQSLTERVSRKPGVSGRKRFAHRLADSPLLRRWLKDPPERAAFLLSAAYLTRDREVKLRVYPGLAPMMIMPVLFILPGGAGAIGGFNWAFCGMYLGLVAMLGLHLLKFSQQWQAADIFRAAPIAGPGPLCHGARKAALLLLAVPLLLLFGAFLAVIGAPLADLPMILPGIIALPVFALLPCLKAGAVPFSIPADDAAAARRGMQTIGALLISGVVASLATAANHFGYLWAFLILEATAAAAICAVMKSASAKARWPSID
jgi:ABC-2 type transport system permease protein